VADVLAGRLTNDNLLNFKFFMVMKTKLIISLLAFLAITTLVSGQNNGVNSRPQNGKGQGRAYVDTNKNSTCDTYENRTSNASVGRRSENFNTCGQGQRQGHGLNGFCKGQGRGRKYVDEDKNGVCDRRDIPLKK
jgi:hypothetical protein